MTGMDSSRGREGEELPQHLRGVQPSSSYFQVGFAPTEQTSYRL